MFALFLTVAVQPRLTDSLAKLYVNHGETDQELRKTTKRAPHSTCIQLSSVRNSYDSSRNVAAPRSCSHRNRDCHALPRSPGSSCLGRMPRSGHAKAMCPRPRLACCADGHVPLERDAFNGRAVCGVSRGQGSCGAFLSCFWRGRILRDYCYGNGVEEGCSVVSWIMFSSQGYSVQLIQYRNVAGDVGTDGDGICRVGDDVRQRLEARLRDDHMAVLVAISFYSRVLRRVRFNVVCDWWLLLDVILGLRSYGHINIHVCGLFFRRPRMFVPTLTTP